MPFKKCRDVTATFAVFTELIAMELLTICYESPFGSAKHVVWSVIQLLCSREVLDPYAQGATTPEDGLLLQHCSSSEGHCTPLLYFLNCFIAGLHCSLWNRKLLCFSIACVHYARCNNFNSAVCLQEILIAWLFRSIYIFSPMEKRTDALVLHTHWSVWKGGDRKSVV